MKSVRKPASRRASQEGDHLPAIRWSTTIRTVVDEVVDRRRETEVLGRVSGVAGRGEISCTVSAWVAAIG